MEIVSVFRLFDPITNDVLFHRAVLFDEHFKHSSDATLSIDCHDGADHADSLVFEEQEDEEHLTAADEETQPVENPPTTVEQPAERKIPDRYDYDPSDFNYFLLLLATFSHR